MVGSRFEYDLHLPMSIKISDLSYIRNLPVLQLIMIDSSVKVIQLSGSLSAILLNTGGSIGTLDRGSTG